LGLLTGLRVGAANAMMFLPSWNFTSLSRIPFPAPHPFG
jgi:hypothetical protein